MFEELLDWFGPESWLLENPCECGIEPSGAMNHGGS